MKNQLNNLRHGLLSTIAAVVIGTTFLLAAAGPALTPALA